MQLNFDDVKRLSRAGDPATSRVAAADALAFISGHERRILAALRGPLIAGTYSQIASVAGMDAIAVARRLRAMADKGLIESTGETRRLPSGRQGLVWKARLEVTNGQQA